MSSKKTKLELTWIGKEHRPKLEPRILLEELDKSHHAKFRVNEPQILATKSTENTKDQKIDSSILTTKSTENTKDLKSDSSLRSMCSMWPNHPGDIFNNMLIRGDNLLGLKALEQEFAGKVKCIYIDPPFNTGQAFEHYDDGVEHSIWLNLMTSRLELLKKLLHPDGTIWVHLDDNEVHYLRVAMDEIFGRDCFVSSVVWRAADSSNNDSKQFSVDHNTILVYSKKSGWLSNPLPRSEAANKHYKNPDNDPKGPWFQGNLSSPNPRPNLCYDIVSPEGHKVKPPANGWRWSKERVDEMLKSGEMIFTNKGTKVLRKTYLADQGGLAPSTLWFDIEETGHNRQAKYELKKLFPREATSDLFKTPKPERLIHRVFQIATNPGDLVLDSFLGSGTTAAVAHKMGRRWIGIELGEHCETHCLPRLKKVVDGEDPGGITQAAGWKGGGGFRYYRLAPSLLEKDKWGNWVVSKEYNAAMLAEAVCKLEGFSYEPSDSLYWQHGHSTERDFIYTTTANLSHDQLQELSDEVGQERSLLVVCSAFRGRKEGYPNLTVKKIPNAVLTRCEWGKDDYSLKVENLPKAPPEPRQQELF
jgi:adenine-specific DNA-methyltransferase